MPKIGLLNLPRNLLAKLSEYLSLNDQLKFTASCKYLYNLRYRTNIPIQTIGLLTYAVNWGLHQPPTPLGIYTQAGFLPIPVLAPQSLTFRIGNKDLATQWENFTDTASLAGVKCVTIFDASNKWGDINSVTHLPSWLGAFSELNHLNVQCSVLETLSDELSQLTNLQYLTISSDVLKNLPSSVGRLASLISLEISCNKLEMLPDELNQLTTLQYLTIRASRLKNFPAGLSRLSELIHLDISANVETLPDELGQLVKLQHLRIFSLLLTALPVCLRTLSNLTTLEIDCNYLKILPDELSQLTKLQHVRIMSEALTYLPAWLNSLPNLVVLARSYRRSKDFMPSEKSGEKINDSH